MGKVSTFTDKETGETYTISTVDKNKKVFVGNKPFHPIYEAALLKGKWPRAKSLKPICVFELIDLPKVGLSLEDFHNKVGEIVKKYGIKNLLASSGSHYYSEEGFHSKSTESFQLFAGSKVRIIYLTPKESITGIHFREMSDDSALHAWEVYYKELLEPELDAEIKSLKKQKDDGSRDIVKAGKLLSLDLMKDAAELTQGLSEVIVARDSKENEDPNLRLDKNLTFFKTVLVLYVQLAYGFSEDRLGKDTEEDERFGLIINDVIMKVLEKVGRKMNATEKVISEEIDYYFNLQNSISERFSSFKWKEPGENQSKGDWGYEAGRLMIEAMYGENSYNKADEKPWAEGFITQGDLLIERFREVTGQG